MRIHLRTCAVPGAPSTGGRSTIAVGATISAPGHICSRNRPLRSLKSPDINLMMVGRRRSCPAVRRSTFWAKTSYLQVSESARKSSPLTKDEKIVKHSSVPSGEPVDSQFTSPSLLARVRAGDEEGWERMVRLYGPLVYSWCRRVGLSAEDAGDVCQEVFTTIATKLDTFHSDRPGDSLRRWLKTVTNNRARDCHRRQKGKAQARGGTAAQLELAAQAGGDDGVLLDESDDERVQESNHLLRAATELVRADFEPNTWQAFWQTVVEGRATADVVADLGMSANAVRVAKSRVRARLREEMEGLLDEPPA